MWLAQEALREQSSAFIVVQLFFAAAGPRLGLNASRFLMLNFLLLFLGATGSNPDGLGASQYALAAPSKSWDWRGRNTERVELIDLA